MNDSELYRRWVEGDSAAGDELVDRHWAPLYRWIKGQVGEAEAGDISQAAWLEAMRGGFRGEGQFAGWMRTIARTQIARARRRRDAELPDIDGRTGTSPSRAVLRREAAEAVDNLPPKVGEPARRYWRGEPAESIASDLGVRVKTVRSRIRIAAERLRGQLA